MSQEQERATLDYWQLSMLFYQGKGADITTSQAIHEAGRCAWNVGEHRLVHHRLLQLQERIIQGKSRKKKPSSTFSLLMFQAKVTNA